MEKTQTTKTYRVDYNRKPFPFTSIVFIIASQSKLYDQHLIGIIFNVCYLFFFSILKHSKSYFSIDKISKKCRYKKKETIPNEFVYHSRELNTFVRILCVVLCCGRFKWYS